MKRTKWFKIKGEDLLKCDQISDRKLLVSLMNVVLAHTGCPEIRTKKTSLFLIFLIL